MSAISNDDDITAADLAAAQERWADPQHESAVPELFSRPAYAPGFRGDVPIQPATPPPAPKRPLVKPDA